MDRKISGDLPYPDDVVGAMRIDQPQLLAASESSGPPDAHLPDAVPLPGAGFVEMQFCLVGKYEPGSVVACLGFLNVEICWYTGCIAALGDVAVGSLSGSLHDEEMVISGATVSFSWALAGGCCCWLHLYDNGSAANIGCSAQSINGSRF
ncbi:hypothetical protein Nepgr_009374 [Nepenthes gracilis]|uniref:Uncharacterized protein n=1 Tax=Nepenthes gracilis TaxID=150966 RepID=A0AAD3SB64_NEPGR|nr:hypothetical protein Nepgr_009374 [Nepenthes gracilis]